MLHLFCLGNLMWNLPISLQIGLQAYKAEEVHQMFGEK